MSNLNLQELPADSRFDPQMQQRVVELASRLQHQDNERMSAHQIINAAEEVGLEPEYVRQAMSQIRLEEAASAAQRRTVPLHVQASASTNRSEFRRFLAAMSAPFVLGAFAFLFKDFTTLAILLGLILPAPMACLSGFLTGCKRVGFVTATLLPLALAPTIYHLGLHIWLTSGEGPNFAYDPHNVVRAHENGAMMSFCYLFFGMPTAGFLGAFGAWARRKYFPFR